MDERQYQTMLDHIDNNSRRIGIMETTVLSLVNEVAEMRGAQKERGKISGFISLIVAAIVSGAISLFSPVRH